MKVSRNRSLDHQKRKAAVPATCVLFVLWIFLLAISISSFSRHSSSMSITRLKMFLSLDAATYTNSIQRRTISNASRDQTRMKLECRNCGNLTLEGTNDQGEKSNLKLERRPMCDASGPRSIICELEGDIRVPGNSTAIIVASSASIYTSQSWQLRPYARKMDVPALSKVRELSLHGNYSAALQPHCTVNHSVAGIVFSTGGHVGNIFHDFSDVLIPLYLTSYHYHGEVQLLVTDLRPWFLSKHQRLLSRLSHYKIIDLDNDQSVHCFSTLTVGLRCHKDFNIDPSMIPLGFSMVNFTKFLRTSYHLERQSISCGSVFPDQGRKPRLLLLTRKWSRTFTNVPEIEEAIKRAGFEVVAMELGWTANLENASRTVNSFDVLMGMHGAGLTNQVFLPAGAVLIQVVPWGKMGDVAYVDYGRPAEHAGLKYIQYEIRLEESSLIEEYPRDHEYLRDPSAVHKRGWYAVREAYLNHNVTLDVNRFEHVLLQAMEQTRSC